MIEMLAGGGLVLLGVLVGRFLPARRRGPKPPKPVQPICGCGHHASYHDPKNGECHGEGSYIANGRYNPCGCRQYSGPQPLPEYYAPELPS